ncbi:Insect odorant-binding protein A10/Ejaculatory bulb-specific protein 3 [Cinara cedri]|uniref:Insect odorant-binding protein A10/Ejaculatory bulb-specific protein 3 n=1 Tax=Cinara cedri TaxID=506608 RepID=A0A5E4MAQ2_9HEMI|nr:Insect odorant-binding protein A10/Ejaculatory bulb-specific protein 3 [Cinara cedri]
MIKTLTVVFCIAVTMAMAKPASYTTKFDNVNIDEILENDRLINNYFKCLMDTGKCTPDGEELKRNLLDAVQNKCASCSEKQKLGSEKIIKFLYEKKSDLWKQLEDKYDPTKIYRQQYVEEAKKLNIEI